MSNEKQLGGWRVRTQEGPIGSLPVGERYEIATNGPCRARDWIEVETDHGVDSDAVRITAGIVDGEIFVPLVVLAELLRRSGYAVEEPSKEGTGGQ